MLEIKAKLSRLPVYFANEIVDCVVTFSNDSSRYLFRSRIHLKIDEMKPLYEGLIFLFSIKVMQSNNWPGVWYKFIVFFILMKIRYRCQLIKRKPIVDY